MQVARLVDYVKSCEPAPGFDNVLVPGELEFKQRQHRMHHGIDVADSVWEDLSVLLVELQNGGGEPGFGDSKEDDTLYCADDFGHALYHLGPAGAVLATLGTPGRPPDTGVSGFDYRTMKQAGGPFNAPTNAAVALTQEAIQQVVSSFWRGTVCQIHFMLVQPGKSSTRLSASSGLASGYLPTHFRLLRLT